MNPTAVMTHVPPHGKEDDEASEEEAEGDEYEDECGAARSDDGLGAIVASGRSSRRARRCR